MADKDHGYDLYVFYTGRWLRKYRVTVDGPGRMRVVRCALSWRGAERLGKRIVHRNIKLWNDLKTVATTTNRWEVVGEKQTAA
jgi:hypothetical protein